MLEILLKIKKQIESDLFFLDYEVESKKELLKEINETIMKNCEHNWITDYIDIHPDRTERIIYCEKCELTKNN